MAVFITFTILCALAFICLTAFITWKFFAKWDRATLYFLILVDVCLLVATIGLALGWAKVI